MKQHDKQRLFEVMQRLDKTFKSGNKLSEQADETSIQDIKSGRQLSIGDVVNAEGLSGEYQVGMKVSEGKPFLMPFSMSSKRANPYHRIYLTALSNPRLQTILHYSDTEGGFMGENQGNLNENIENNQYLPITTPIGSEDDKLFTGIVNQGIDSHLEGFTKSTFDVKDGSLGKRRVFNFHTSELPILLRRLEELGTEESLQWKDDIENYDNNINEMDGNENKNWFEDELGYLKNNQTFTRVELRDILETLYKNVDISGQYRIMYLLELFGMDENFR